MTTTALSYRAIHNKFTSVSFPIINLKMVYVFSTLLSSLMLVFYIYSVNELTKGAYLIKNYNKEINTLLNENKELEANFAKASFLGEVQQKAKELSFEKTKEVKYVEILDSSLAKATDN